MISRKDFSTWGAAYAVGGQSANRWGGLSVVTGLLAFGFDFLFAISLQRFLGAIGLISPGDGLDGLPFLGPVQSTYFEAVFFLAIGICRSLVVWANSVSTGVCQVAFEANAKRKVSQWALCDGSAATGRVANLFNDIVLCSGAAVSTSYYLLGRVLMVIAAIATLFYYSEILTAFLMIVLVVASPLHRYLDRRITFASKNIQQALANVSDRLMTGVKNSIFLHIHGILGKEVSEQRKLVSRYERSSREYYSLSSSRSVVPQILGIIVVVIIAVQGSESFASSKGDLVAYLYLVMRFFQTLSDAARVTANIRGNWPRLKLLVDWHDSEYSRVHKKMETELSEEGRVSDVPQSVGLSLRGVSYSWPDGEKVLDQVNLDFPAGSSTVVLGPSGTGKTTLLLLLCRILEPTNGQVLVNLSGVTMPIEEARDELLSTASYVGPDPFMISGTIREFLMFGQNKELDDIDFLEALKQAHCDFVCSLPEGLEHRLAEQGGGLSAGQKQRLSIARALLRKPRLLLLDEATSNLDADSEQAIIDTVRSLHGTVTVVSVTHRDALREVADTIIQFEGNGKLSCQTCGLENQPSERLPRGK